MNPHSWTDVPPREGRPLCQTLNLAPQTQNPTQVRETAVIKEVMKTMLTSAKQMHSVGLVHRDIKPANVIVSEVTTSKPLLLADLGATVISTLDPKTLNRCC